MSHLGVGALKRGLLLFWALDLTIVSVTNLLDGLKALDVLPPGWPMASGNYPLLVKAIGVYGWPAWVAGLALAGAIVWEAAAAALFWRAWRCLPARAVAAPGVLYPPFVALVGLWSAFLVADEFFIAYTLNGTHAHFFTAALATLLAVALLPD
ncbi:MAG TPA: hypothetical protein VK066_27015 [Chloroflexota bacterium]|nr:hypothetical protein [Chloroflexota bacterium]